MENKRVVKAVNLESFLWLFGIVVFFGLIGNIMGIADMFKTMMATANMT